MDERSLIPRTFPNKGIPLDARVSSRCRITLVHVWMGLPNPPLFLFDKIPLFSLAKIIGMPMCMDTPTTKLSRSRPNLAKVCVQADLLKKLPSKIWVTCGESLPGFWQQVQYGNLPTYCRHCNRLGYDVHS